MEARNRKLNEWYGKIQRGEIKLPRFQRHEAWDRQRIASLLDTVIHDLPLGITLTLEVVPGNEPFISRFLETTTPKEGQRVLEHLLDGQQRLTALWRTFHNNYPFETYFVYIEEFDKTKDREQTDMSIFCRNRYEKKNGELYPLWCDLPAECLKRGYIPTHLLRPEDIQNEIDEWLDQATKLLEPEDGKDEFKAFHLFQKKVSDKIKDLRSVVANYNLPFLSLPSNTAKSVALDVFIKMNTNSKPLSQYDVIVAEVESVMGSSLHDLQETLHKNHPNIAKYSALPDLILTTSALLQNKFPNQNGAWDMDKKIMVQKWGIMERGLARMADFLLSEGIYDKSRLPTNAVLAVIAALYEVIPVTGDKRGQDERLLKKYMWYSFFTDRYENSAATHAYYDFMALRRIISGELKENDQPYTDADVPIFSSGDHKFVEKEELIKADWPKGASIRGRAVLAVANRLGALDFSTGEKIHFDNIGHRHYHHLFPDSLLKEANIESYLALNCALISDTTNMSIGRKDPLKYLTDRYKWATPEIVMERLQSHLIPIEELSNGGYEGLSDEVKKGKIKIDFETFIDKRAELVLKAARLLAEGRQISPNSLYQEPHFLENQQ
ncbi:MAG: DUF262 domain-containing protein [Candidatus Delongbacteria bacterium]